jgi:hypothetical protein
MKLLRELVEAEQENVDALPLMEVLEESLQSLSMQHGGGKVNSMIGGAKDFFKANPGLVTGAAVLAVSALKQYQKNKRNTVRLHGKTSSEKRMMTSIADALQKEGKFKLDKIKFEGGGKTWVLKRKWS